jgi:sugar phosphate isomerase/epimerase
MQIGLKLSSINKDYTSDILSFYENDYFQYIELFAVFETFGDTIDYWKQFSIPIIIHAPHSFAGMNLSLSEERNNNIKKLEETFQFADALNAEYIIFHSGVNGSIGETIHQLHPFVDARCLIENKPLKGFDNTRGIGSIASEICFLRKELNIGFCLDFGHAICAANSLQQKPLQFIHELLQLNPTMYHLTDGDYKGEYDSHLHYGQGDFPIEEILRLIPQDAKLTNEAKHNSEKNLNDFIEDVKCLEKYI